MSRINIPTGDRTIVLSGIVLDTNDILIRRNQSLHYALDLLDVGLIIRDKHKFNPGTLVRVVYSVHITENDSVDVRDRKIVAGF